MIHVRTFGSPNRISNKAFGSVRNYVSESDLIPYANYFLRLGPVSKTNTIILPSNAWFEHSWNCETYQTAFHKDLHLTIKEYGVGR